MLPQHYWNTWALSEIFLNRKGTGYNMINHFDKHCQLLVTWANMHHELWLLSMINGQNNVGNSNYQNAGFMKNFQVPAIPNGYCIRYHQCHYCQLPCRYNHKCFNCNRLHPSCKCWQQQVFWMKMQMHLIIFVPQVLRDNPAQDFKYHREINVCQGLQSDNFNTLRVCNYGYNI